MVFGVNVTVAPVLPPVQLRFSHFMLNTWFLRASHGLLELFFKDAAFAQIEVDVREFFWTVDV